MRTNLKRVMTRKMMTPKEIQEHVDVFHSKAWIDRKQKRKLKGLKKVVV